MNIRTRSLFHFAKSFDTLKAILQGGFFWPRYSLEDFNWASHDSTPFNIGIPMTCFCDIPLSRIEEHTEYYGGYGFGLHQEWGLRKGLNPIVYLNEESPLRENIIAAVGALLLKHKDATKTHDGSQAALREILHLLAYTKPYVGSTMHSGKMEVKDFYEESEWRYVPAKIFESGDFLVGEESMKDPGVVKNANKRTLTEGPLAFGLNDIRYIFVPNISEIPLLFDHIHQNLGTHPLNDLKVLTTKIFSLEQLMEDI